MVREEECDTSYCSLYSLCDGCMERPERFDFLRRTGRALIFGSPSYTKCYGRKVMTIESTVRGVWQDAGLGTIGGAGMYWDTNDDGTVNIFPVLLKNWLCHVY